MKNYTSTVPAEKSIANIEKLLAKAGAKNISKTYSEGKVTALVFQILEPSTCLSISIQLPANAPAIEKHLRKRKAVRTSAQAERIKEQAERTAWKIIQEWVAIQLSMIEMQQAELLEIFLPYVKGGEKTFFHTLRETKFKLLPSPKNP